ncbi:hypothetical protein QE408_003155 [Agrobacterium larrymoorei]|uniref:Uncharacterized protein n=1 Tax=Agrobacterium larrymoorei TaxID=160699 RepID=A0ABU0UM35_9HYPH|nr:hypothetical protein [Agrobacterium larrymoorei]
MSRTGETGRKDKGAVEKQAKQSELLFYLENLRQTVNGNRKSCWAEGKIYASNKSVYRNGSE